MTSIDIMARRAYVFELWSRGISPPEIQRMASSKHNRNESTIRKDLHSMKDWLPELINMKYSSDERAAELIAKSRIIYENLINLAETTNHPFSKVGAYGKALVALKFEAEFLQSTGKVEKVAEKIEAKLTGPTKINLIFSDTLKADPKEDEEIADDSRADP